MTYYDVIDKICYQIRALGAIISLIAKFGANQSSFGKTDSRNPAIILHLRGNFKILIYRMLRNKILRPAIFGFTGFSNTGSPENLHLTQKKTTKVFEQGRKQF